MNRTEIIINGQALDLFPDTDIAITFQQNDLQEIVTRQFNYSNDFSLPITDRNTRLLGHANLASTSSGLPYRYTDVAVISDGIQITDNAILQVVSVDESFKVFISERSVPFWQSIDGLTCRDAYAIIEDATQYINGLRTAARMNQFNTFAGDNPRVVYPICDFGHGLEFESSSNSYRMDARYQYPAVFVCDIVSQIITKAGYTLDSSLTNDSDYQKLAIVYGGPDASDNAYGIYNIIPDTSQKEFLKVVGFLFGVDFLEDPERTSVIITREFDAAINSIVTDWSGKLNWLERRRYERFWGNWAKENRFAYENDAPLNNEAQALIAFENSTLAKSYDAFNIPYSASRNIANWLNTGLDVAQVPKILEVDDEGKVSKTNSLNFRLVFIERAQLRVTYYDRFTPGGILQTTFVPYATFPDELNLINVIDTKYKLLKSIFSKPLKITARFDLSSKDISMLDLRRLVYIDDTYRNEQINGYFLVNKVNNYLAGEFTEVELIQVGAQSASTGVTIPDVEQESFYLVDAEGDYLRDAENDRLLNDIE